MSIGNLEVLNTVLGRGRSSSVHLGRLREQVPGGGGQIHERLVAVKWLHHAWCHGQRERVQREAAHHMFLSAYNHPFISKMLSVELLPTGLGLVMEYKAGAQTLDKLQHSYGGCLPQSVARQLFAQLMVALDFCHRLGLCNRDCKITDLLVHVDAANGNVKLQLTDFSFAKAKEYDCNSNPVAQHGSALFAAPEIIAGAPDGQYSGYKADVWSAGVVLCTLVFGCHPHLATDRLQAPSNDQIVNIVNNALKGAIQVPAAKIAAHPEASELMSAMLAVDPAARPDTSAILAHPWVRAELSATPALLELNGRLLSDVRLRDLSSAIRDATRVRTGTLLDRLFGVAGGS